MKVSYNKLVRDRIPEIIRSGGEKPVARVFGADEYKAALLAKLAEEAQEVREAPAEELAAELADVLEVLQAIATAHNVRWDQVADVAVRKRAERGAFDERIFLEWIEEFPHS
jgi:predicted house-cleaning noncanonical NTP pyrophosphatase (MazG superfamily)